MPGALVVDDEAVVDASVRALQAAIFQIATFNRTPIDRFPSPDFPEMILEPDATFCLRKPFTPNAVPAALNRCLAKPIANARLAQ